ncbi:low molecular weight phosphatase family protein [Cyclobacterium sp. SYSU L10401]|uniref:arsenate-mycothiol transferase ArsC n=1 Tax=Cyclobacterium sp. SYSU L10401 TaxID=2678657 RepID=UPI0013D7E67D|nr:protein-tyrosine-phosphatase [Cyclobacterium sp. SYSU L10401]
MSASNNELFPEIQATIKSLDIHAISKERKALLQSLTTYIQDKVNQDKVLRLNFICTHNSRRSHLSQIWAQAMAAYYGIPHAFCYSGGTAATALFPMAAETLANQGFEITTLSEGKNPIYSIKYGENAHPVIGFSKTYDDTFNPKSEFAAIMTCSQADEGCPYIAGAEKRIPITYDDPKAFDHTPQQAEKYLERSLQIATELSHAFSKIK